MAGNSGRENDEDDDEQVNRNLEKKAMTDDRDRELKGGWKPVNVNSE